MFLLNGTRQVGARQLVYPYCLYYVQIFLHNPYEKVHTRNFRLKFRKIQNFKSFFSSACGIDCTYLRKFLYVIFCDSYLFSLW